MNNPNMYTNKKQKGGFLKYIIIWMAILAVIIFFLVRSLGTSSTNAYTWNIIEYEQALTEQVITDEDGNIVYGNNFHHNHLQYCFHYLE